MANESGITALGPEDIENNVENLGTVEVSPNVEGTEQKESAFPQFTDEAKRQRGIEEFKSFKKGFKQALPYIGQLGADLVPGSGITEIFGQQIDVVEGGKRPSFPKQVERTTELAKEGKTTEAIVSGVDTLLTGAAGAGEGMMVAGAVLPSIYGKALSIAGWGLYGLSKGGRAILRNTKTGKKILADIEGNAQTGYDIKSIKIPENVESDDTIKTLEDNIDIETVKTDDTDTEVAIPELAKDLNTTEAITGYVVAPNKLDRDQLVAKVENDPEVKTKTDKYLEEQGVSGDTVPIYRLINVEDKVKRRLGDPFPEVLKKAEIGNESIISGSLTPKANIKTYDFFEPKVGVNTTTELVRYDVPRDRIKIAMGGFKNDIKQNVNKKLKEKGFGQEKISGLKTVTNPSKTAKELIDMQDEIIADVTGLEKTVLNKGPSFGLSYDVGAARDIIDGKIKTIEDYKNYKGSSYYPISSEERTNFIKNKTPIEEVEKLAEKRYIDEANKITDFYGLPRLGATKPDEGIKALGPNKIEDIIKPKGEIRSQGGFIFSPEVTQKNLRLQKTRLKKLKEGVQTAGEPKNKRIVLKSDNPDNPDFAIGKIDFDDWTKRVEKVLSDDEIKGATNWYSEVYDYFKSAPYIKSEEEAKTLAQAWFAGAQRKSPQKALANVLSIRSLLRQGNTPEEILAMDKIEEGGLEGATKAILSVLTGREASGVGFKLSDFRDNLDNKNVRSVMGNDPEGGQPFTVDVHTARDMGLVDPPLLNLLKDKGYKIPDNIIDDFGDGGLSNDLYQNRAIFGLELTDHLNKIKWKGKDDWQPSEIQAIGWTTLTNLYGGVNTAGNIKDALNLNVRRVSMEVKPGTGSPWDKMFGKDYSELPISDQIKINDEITNEAINEIAKSENVDLYNNVFGTGGWQTYVNPSTVQEILGIKSEAIRIGAKLGYVLNQTEIYINGSKALTKNPQAYTYDLVERDSTKLRDSKYINDLFTQIYEKTNGVIVGFQPIETIDNKIGIRMIVGPDTVNKFYKDRKIPKKGNESKKNQFFEKDLQKQIEDVIKNTDEEFDLFTTESDLTVLKNDWKNKGEEDGQNYKQYFSKKTVTDGTTESDRVLDNIRQKLTDSFRDKIRNAQGTKRPDTEEVLVSEDIGTEDIPKKSIGGFIERNTYDWVYRDA